MKKISIFIAVCLFISFGLKAQNADSYSTDTVLMYYNGSVIYQNNAANINSLKMTDNTSNLLITEDEI